MTKKRALSEVARRLKQERRRQAAERPTTYRPFGERFRREVEFMFAVRQRDRQVRRQRYAKVGVSNSPVGESAILRDAIVAGLYGGFRAGCSNAAIYDAPEVAR